MLASLSAAWTFALAHWQELLIGLVVVLSVANKLWPGHPWLAGPTRRAVDFLTLIPMPGAKSRALLALAGWLGPNAAGVFVDGLARWLNLPFSSSVAVAPPPPDNVVSLPPRGSAELAVLFALVGVVVAGTFAYHGFYGVALAWLGVFGLALYLAGMLRGARGPMLAIAALVFASSSGCSWFNAERRAALGQDLLACGISIGLAEFQTVDSQAQAALGDWRISDDEAHAALDALEATAQAGLLKCIAQLTVDAFKSMPAPAPQPARAGSAIAARALVLDSPFGALEPPQSRAHRRAAAWLAKKADPR
jgi:hypothetical protein